MASISYGSLPFLEQIAFFRAKGDVLTESYLDVWEAENDIAFMVAGANRADLVADFRAAIDRVIAEGATLAQFRKDFDRIVARYGWAYNGGRNWRSRVIYETNLRQSYNAGRWAQLQRLKAVRPYWRYRHDDSVEVPRPIHEGWDGLVLSADDEWWLTHFPANGWGCQCYVEALNERELRALGKSGPDQAPPVNMQVVTVGANSPGGPRLVLTPEGVDPGFGYAPGASVAPGAAAAGPTPQSLLQLMERTAQIALEKMARLPAPAAAQAAAEILVLPRVAAAIESGYARWRLQVQAAEGTQGLAYGIGALEPELVAALLQDAVSPATARLLVRDGALGAALASAPAQLPALLRGARAVLLDLERQALLYLVQIDGEADTQALVFELSGADGNALQEIEPLTRAQASALVAGGRLRLLRGSLD